MQNHAHYNIRMKKTNKKIKIVIISLWVLIFTPIVVIFLTLGLIRVGAFGQLPTFEELESPKSNIATNIISEDGKTIGSFFVHNRSFVSYDELSPNLISALIATEDARYHSHAGIDFISLARVGIKTILMGNNQGGGSTISQQLAKNLYPRDTTRHDSKIDKLGRLYISKLKEWITASMLERNYTKEEIITMYFNVVEYGSNAYGIKAASKVFFDKHPSEVTVEEAAVLVGVVNAPTRYSPIRHPNNSLNRRNLVIRRMITNGNLPENIGDSILKIPINLNYTVISHNEGTSTYFRGMLSRYMNANEPKRSSYYMKWDYEMAMNKWRDDPLYGWCSKNTKPDGTKYDLYRDGLTIYTTINSVMQEYAEESLVDHMKNTLQPKMDMQIKTQDSIFYGVTGSEREAILLRAMKASDRYRELKRGGASDKEIKANFAKKTEIKVFSYDNPRGVDTLLSPMDSMLISLGVLRSSFVAMEPSNGHVKAYVGGSNFRFFKYDMAMQGKRQVGSTIKPFIYTFAIDHLGLTPCTPVPNSQVTVDGWTPKEASEVAQIGELHPLWWGLAKSRNNYSAWIIKQSNYNAVVDLIHKLGVDSYVAAVPSMCLGPSDISLYEMVSAFSTFVNMGVHVDPIFVSRIEDRNGNLVASFSSNSTDAISKNSAFQVLEMLKKVVSWGTGGRLGWEYNLRGDIGGKTGTTDNNSDGWFIGVAPKLVAGVWVGGENRSTRLSWSDGSRMAMPIYASFMNKVHKNKDLGVSASDKFIRPMGVTPIRCAENIETDEREQQAKDEENIFFS